MAFLKAQQPIFQKNASIKETTFFHKKIKSMKKISTFPLLILIFTCLGFQMISEETEGTLKGIVTNNSGEPLIGVNIIVPSLRTGASTNEYGFYSLTLEEGTYDIVISYLGFKTITQTLVLDADKALNFRLEENLEELARRPERYYHMLFANQLVLTVQPRFGSNFIKIFSGKFPSITK